MEEALPVEGGEAAPATPAASECGVDVYRRLTPESPHVRQTRLPIELILQIIDSVVPSNPGLILPPSHSATKTLLAFLCVCRGTYHTAVRILRARCLYIESGPRLAKLLLCMYRSVPSLRTPSPLSLRNITSLYLAPFGESLDDLPTAVWVRELLFEVSHSLRRLVVRMPFQSLDLLEDHLNVKETLRSAFAQLEQLEEFVSVGDYPALNLHHSTTDVWRLWPRLRRLTLFHVPLDSHWLWWNIATLPQLQHVVLACPESLQAANVKRQYFRALPPENPLLQKELRIVLVDMAYEIGTLQTSGWRAADPQQRMTVETYEVPLPFYDDAAPASMVDDWIQRGALDGSLWQWKGRIEEEKSGQG